MSPFTPSDQPEGVAALCYSCGVPLGIHADNDRCMTDPFFDARCITVPNRSQEA